MADKSLVFQGPVDAAVGFTYSLKVQFSDATGGRLYLDAAPSLRIYRLNGDGSETPILAPVTLAQQGSTPSWATTWVPALAGVFTVEVTGLYLGVPVLGSWGLDAHQRFDTVTRRVGG